jgi:hypothetical protein
MFGICVGCVGGVLGYYYIIILYIILLYYYIIIIVLYYIIHYCYYITYYTLLFFYSPPLSSSPHPPSFILYLSILIYTYLYSFLINKLTPHILSEACLEWCSFICVVFGSGVVCFMF